MLRGQDAEAEREAQNGNRLAAVPAPNHRSGALPVNSPVPIHDHERDRLPNRRACETSTFEHGADLDLIRAAMKRNSQGLPSSPIGEALDRIAP
jgi:hypothetical protein